MALLRDPNLGGSSTDSGSLAASFGNEKQQSEAIKSAKAFSAAAKSGKFRIDPEVAKAAIKEIARAEEAMRQIRHDVGIVTQSPKIGSSPYAERAVGWYEDGGQSCRKAVLNFEKVLSYTREGYEYAVESYERIDADRAQTFDRGL
ncbi:hypothetical protein [Haloechinothrix halophila]|uniref:hypothetical protein n=1 Tax=Haloechinothrix halophila TaxID=1069073 RepID=UPI000551F894|nr:hypothetical protein [Haloechinothrix halophila]